MSELTKLIDEMDRLPGTSTKLVRTLRLIAAQLESCEPAKSPACDPVKPPTIGERYAPRILTIYGTDPMIADPNPENIGLLFKRGGPLIEKQRRLLANWIDAAVADAMEQLISQGFLMAEARDCKLK